MVKGVIQVYKMFWKREYGFWGLHLFHLTLFSIEKLKNWVMYCVLSKEEPRIRAREFKFFVSTAQVSSFSTSINGS